MVWKNPSRKKPMLSARNFMMFRHLSPVRLPSLRRKLNLRLPSLDEQVIRLPKTEVRAEEEPQEPLEVDQVETQGQEDNKRCPCSNGDAASTSRPLETQGNLTSSWCSPRPLEGNVHLKGLTEKNQTDKVQVHAVSFYSKGVESPAHTALLELMVGKELQHKDPAALASSSSSPPRAVSHRSCKRKLSGPPLPLPPPPPLQLRWDRDELSPPAKLPCLSPEGLLELPQASQRERRLPQGNMVKNMGVLSRTSKSRRRKQPLGRRKKTWQGGHGGSHL
uniref:Uncharacterized protein n=1 Tax=Colobus angolensis palliatus TaxID=336983 RepID=A0A2K5K125_COLAP